MLYYRIRLAKRPDYKKSQIGQREFYRLDPLHATRSDSLQASCPETSIFSMATSSFYRDKCLAVVVVAAVAEANFEY